MGIYGSLRLPDHCSVYQAEVTSIQEAMMHIEIVKSNTRESYLFSDSQAALKVLDSCVDIRTSRLTDELATKATTIEIRKGHDWDAHSYL